MKSGAREAGSSSNVASLHGAVGRVVHGRGRLCRDQSGAGPGVIVDANTGTLVTASAPAHVGDTLVIYCNGLGAVTPPIPTGQPAPAGGPLSVTNNPVSITIGGIAATVNFAGLAPGFPDLYQVNAVVPPGVSPGTAVPVVLNVAGQTSPTVTMTVE